MRGASGQGQPPALRATPFVSEGGMGRIVRCHGQITRPCGATLFSKEGMG